MPRGPQRTEVPQARVDRVRAQRAATAVRNQRRRLLRAADPESTRVYPRRRDRLRVRDRGGAAGGGEQDRGNHRRGSINNISPLPRSCSAPISFKIVLLSKRLATLKLIRLGKLAFIVPVITSTLGR